MTRLSWQDNSATIIHWITILSNNPLSYPYFCENFSHTIDFFNKAMLTYNFDDDSKKWDMLYNHYVSFLTEYTKLFGLQEESHYLKKDWNNITVSLIVVVLEHLKQKMKDNTDLLKPLEQYQDKSMDDYIAKYFENQKILYDYNLKNFLFSIEEVFNFKNEETKDTLQNLSESGNGNEIVETILNTIRYIKDHPKEKEREREKDLCFWVNPDNVNLERRTEPTQMLAYYLFNLIFLEKPYFLYYTWEPIKFWDNIYLDWILVDKFTLNQIQDCGNSGLTIQSSLPFKMFNTFMDDQETFQALKKAIASEYEQLFNNANSWKEKLEKAMKFIEESMKNFGKTEFYIGTKNQSVSFVKSIVVEADKKRYYEVQQKLWTEEYKNEQWRRIFTKKTKIEDMEK